MALISEFQEITCQDRLLPVAGIPAGRSRDFTILRPDFDCPFDLSSRVAEEIVRLSAQGGR